MLFGRRSYMKIAVIDILAKFVGDFNLAAVKISTWNCRKWNIRTLQEISDQYHLISVYQLNVN